MFLNHLCPAKNSRNANECGGKTLEASTLSNRGYELSEHPTDGNWLIYNDPVGVAFVFHYPCI